MNDVATLVPNKPDADVASDIRKRAEAVLAPMCALMDEAKSAGFTIGFNIGSDYRGRNIIGSLKIIKEY